MRDNRSMPKATVIPVLAYGDLPEAADWLERAFGFSPHLWIADHRVQLDIGGGGAIVLTRAARPVSPAAGQSVMVRVEDVDTHFDRARQAGAQILHPPESFPYGEWQYSCRDFAGYAWTFSESLADVDPASWGGRLTATGAA